jgi:hypothetical protein
MEKEASVENLDQSNPVESSQVPMRQQPNVDEEHYFGPEDAKMPETRPERKKRR